MNTIELLQRLQATQATIFSANDLRLIGDIRRDPSLYMTLHRLVARGLLKKIDKGLFARAEVPTDPFQLANFLRRPSYVSLESALNLHGILVQTPRMVTSATTGRPVHLNAVGREFVYRHLNRRLWFGFERNGTFLVATPEKAFLDWLYLAARGERPSLLDDLRWRRLNLRQLDRWTAEIPSRSFQRAYRHWLKIK